MVERGEEEQEEGAIRPCTKHRRRHIAAQRRRIRRRLAGTLAAQPSRRGGGPPVANSARHKNATVAHRASDLPQALKQRLGMYNMRHAPASAPSRLNAACCKGDCLRGHNQRESSPPPGCPAQPSPSSPRPAAPHARYAPRGFSRPSGSSSAAVCRRRSR